MRVTRVHVPGDLAAGIEIVLPAQTGEHLTRVLRLEPGAPFTVFNGRGGEFAAVLGARSGKEVRARLVRHDPVERESPLDITLLQGVARGERMDLIVQKATELGVSRILPVLAERSVVRVDAQQRARKRDHWQAIAISACEQCGRNRVPAVEDLIEFGAALSGLPAAPVRLLLESAAAESLSAVALRLRPRAVALLVGPEGGSSEAERRFAAATGFIACRMGARVLRTETAGLAALTILQTTLGDFA